MKPLRRCCLKLSAGLGLASPLAASFCADNAFAQTGESSPSLDRILDRDFPGPPIALDVDMRDLQRRVYRCQQRVGVAAWMQMLAAPDGSPRQLGFFYPRWLPGYHGPYGDPSRLAGLLVSDQDGRRLVWRRDPLNPQRFVVSCDAAVRELTFQYEFLTPIEPQSGRIVVSTEIAQLQWHAVVLYPEGFRASRILYSPRLRLPAGWAYGCSLLPAGIEPREARAEVFAASLTPSERFVAPADGWIDFAPVSLEMLVDSPVFSGRFARRVALDAGDSRQPVSLFVVGDAASRFDASVEQWNAHRRLIAESDVLFGHRPFNHYVFLLSISDRVTGIGLEHHESSENGVSSRYFRDWNRGSAGRDLLAHEYVHSWNGKYRRPAKLWTPHYNTEMVSELLWLYEGQTQYWGNVLAARSGFVTIEQSLDDLAFTVASYEQRPGRRWRSMQDTTYQATMAARQTQTWHDWQRGADYYDEAALMWTEVDAELRSRSNGKRSLDDFAARFFSIGAFKPGGPIQVSLYDEDDIAAHLNAVEPGPWKAFLRERLDSWARPGQGSVGLRALERCGWALRFRETPSPFARPWEAQGPSGNFQFSLGLSIRSDGRVDRVSWGSPAFEAGIVPASSIQAVAGRSYSTEALAAAITANRSGQAPIELIVRDGEQWRSLRIDYREGLRYPYLERLPGRDDHLTAILSPRTATQLGPLPRA